MSRITQATSTRGASPSHSPPDMTYAPAAGLAHGLGWFSIALGLTQLCCTRWVCRATGIKDEGLMRCCGLREVATGVALLASSEPRMAMWGRVGGDVMDLAILTNAMVDNDHDSSVRAMEAAAVVAGVTALDMYAAVQISQTQR